MGGKVRRERRGQKSERKPLSSLSAVLLPSLILPALVGPENRICLGAVNCAPAASLKIGLKQTWIDRCHIGVRKEVTEPAQSVEKEKCLFGQGAGRTPGTGIVIRWSKAACQRVTSLI